MKWGLAFSPPGARALAEHGSVDRVVARGPAALAAARRHGLDATSADALCDTEIAEEVDRLALVAARSWRPGRLSPLLGDVDLGLLAEYDLIYVAGRILRLAAALDGLAGRGALVVAGTPGSPEVLVAEAVAQAKAWRLQVVRPLAESPSPLDIAARGRLGVSLARRLARYWLARYPTRGAAAGWPVAAYVSGEAAPLLLGLADAGVARLVLDPTEPPPRALARAGVLRGALWAGGRVRRGSPAASRALPALPTLAWRGIDLGAAFACGLAPVIGPQLPGWKRYAEDLLVAWRRGGVRAVILSNDCTAAGRARTLVAHRLGIPSIVIQHGVLMWIGDRNHEVGDYSAAWGPLAAHDFVDRGIAAERIEVVGWPTANARVPEIRERAVGSEQLALILTTDLPIGTALVPEDAVEQVAAGTVAAVRSAGWDGRVVLKIHPGQDPRMYRELLAAAGHPDVEVLGGASDPWPLMAVARTVVTASSSIACALPHLGKRAVLYDIVRPPYAPYLARFAEFEYAATPETAQHAVAGLMGGRGAEADGRVLESALDYASHVPDADERFAALVTRAVRRGPVGRGALERALDAGRPVAFDRLPLRAARLSLDR